MKIRILHQFRDKTTAENIEDQKILEVGDIIECDEALARERIGKGLAEAVESKFSKKTEKVEEPEEEVKEETSLEDDIVLSMEEEKVLEERKEEKSTKKEK